MADKDTQGEEMIGKLIASAGRGVTASPAARERVYAAVRARWEAETRCSEGDDDAAMPKNVTRLERPASAGNRFWSRMSFRVVALAATVAAVAVTVNLLQPGRPGSTISVELAGIQQVQGASELLRADEVRALGAAGSVSTIFTGDTLRTGGDGRIALVFADGILLRVDTSTEISFVDPTAIELSAGTVYIDSGSEGTAGTLGIRTPLGEIEHLGTQYEVAVGDSALRLRVREGRVIVRGSADETVGTAGEQLDFDANGLTARSEIAADDPAWNWTIALATLAPADEYEIGATLEWIARERGLTLEYADASSRQQLSGRVVFGLEGLDPVETLDVLERTTTIRSELQGTRLIVSE